MSKNNDVKAQSLKIPKIILITAKFLEVISPKFATLFAAKLFTTPIKYKIPKREFHMDSESEQNTLLIPSINKEIVMYHYGRGEKKALLVHGWSGRGTQLVKIADELVRNGYSVVSFDAPAHGKSKGNSSIMIEFTASILEIEKQYGTFEIAIGHSLGGMSILNAIKQKLQIKKAVIIGSGDIIQDIIDNFILNLKLKPNISIRLRDYFEDKYQEKMENYAASFAAKEVKIPVLVIHDLNDEDVDVKAAHNIKENLVTSEIMVTEGLGHRKILGNKEVINRIVEFIKK